MSLDKPAMTWLKEEELAAIADLAREWDMTYEGVVRHAVRQTQLIYKAAKEGYTIYLRNDKGEDFMPVVGCPDVGD